MNRTGKIFSEHTVTGTVLMRNDIIQDGHYACVAVLSCYPGNRTKTGSHEWKPELYDKNIGCKSFDGASGPDPVYGIDRVKAAYYLNVSWRRLT